MISSDWSTEAEDTSIPISNRKAKKRSKKNKKRKFDTTKNTSWNGNNTKTFFNALTKDANIVYDLKKIIDSKVTGKDVHISELRTAGRVGTRSTVDDDTIAGRIETRSKKSRQKSKLNLGHISTFSEAKLPSDDDEDTEFNLSDNDHSRTMEVRDTESDGEASEASDLEVVDEATKLSFQSEDSAQNIAKKTRSKVKIIEPIEKIVDEFRPPDYEDFKHLEPFHDANTQDYYSSFLYNTFVNDVDHAEDEDDDDFNPNEFIDELLDPKREEVVNGIISRKEARDLQYELLEVLYPEPTIILHESNSMHSECAEVLLDKQPEGPVFYSPSEERFGFNCDTYRKLITQMHMHVQILGQNILMARHNYDWNQEYFNKVVTWNPLYASDKLLFDFISDLGSLKNLVEVQEVTDHAWNIRHQAFWTPTNQVKKISHSILSDATCSLLVTSSLFPFFELYPMMNKVWFTKDGPTTWNGHALSPGEENLFFLYYIQYLKENNIQRAKSVVAFLDYMRSHSLMTNRTDDCLLKTHRNLIRRKKDPVLNYQTNGILPRKSIVPDIPDNCFFDFISFDERLRRNFMEINTTGVADFLLNYTCKKKPVSRVARKLGTSRRSSTCLTTVNSNYTNKIIPTNNAPITNAPNELDKNSSNRKVTIKNKYDGTVTNTSIENSSLKHSLNENDAVDALNDLNENSPIMNSQTKASLIKCVPNKSCPIEDVPTELALPNEIQPVANVKICTSHDKMINGTASDLSKQLRNSQSGRLKNAILNCAHKISGENRAYASVHDVFRSNDIFLNSYYDPSIDFNAIEQVTKTIDPTNALSTFEAIAKKQFDELSQFGLPESLIDACENHSQPTNTKLNGSSQNDSTNSNSSNFIAKKNSIFPTVEECQNNPQLSASDSLRTMNEGNGFTQMSGRQIAEQVLCPMLEKQLQISEEKRDIFEKVSNYSLQFNKSEEWFRCKIQSIYENMIESSSEDSEEQY